MFIFSNLAISLDGKIGTQQRGVFPLGTRRDYREMLKLRKDCDALIIGASTLRTWRKPSLAQGSESHPINVILSSTLEGISPRWEFFTHSKLKRILFIGEKTPLVRIKRFEGSSEIIVLKKFTKHSAAARQIIHSLENRGIKRLLVEGGGEVMWQFVSENLIDEYHVTLTPKLLGGSFAPTLVDGKGFKSHEILQLKLKQCKVVNDEIFLVYRKK